MVGRNGQGFVFGRNDDGTPGQVVGLSEEPTGTLVDSGYRRFIEDVVGNSAYIKMMPQVFVHLPPGDPFHVAAGNNPGSKR